MEARSTRPVPGSGWVMFTAVLFLVLGVFNVLNGIVALANDSHFVHNLFFGDLTFWGIVMLLIGLVQLYTSMQLFSGRGQGLAILLLGLNLIAQLLFLPAYPVWSIIVMVIDVMAIYGLTVYSEQFEG
jgi:hypothetical protein